MQSRGLLSQTVSWNRSREGGGRDSLHGAGAHSGYPPLSGREYGSDDLKAGSGQVCIPERRLFFSCVPEGNGNRVQRVCAETEDGLCGETVGEYGSVHYAGGLQSGV